MSENYMNAVYVFSFVLSVNDKTKITDVVANDGQWHHIAMSWSNNSGEWKLYKDAVVLATGSGFMTGQVLQGKHNLVRSV